jgi:predicted enzyme related to lactoylglutathione lyase
MMAIKEVLAGLAVMDFDQALTWYERLLGRPADRRPMDGLAEWHFSGTGVIQVIQDSDRAGSGRLTLSIDDLRSYVEEIQERGLTPSAVDDRTSDKVLISTIADPEGNALTLVEPRTA